MPLSEDLMKLGNSLQNASSSLKNLKDAADRSTLQQLLAYQDSLYNNIDPENPDNDGYVQKLQKTYDPEEFNRIEQEQIQKMTDKMAELKVDNSVRKMYEENYLPQFRQQLNNAKYNAYIENYINTSSQKWNTKIDTVNANSNWDYTRKRQELESYWNEVGLDEIKKYNPNLVSIDDAMEAMQASCVTDFIDNYYRREPIPSMSETQIADTAVQALIDQLPEGQTLDADTEFALRQTAAKKVSEHETALQKKATEDQNQMFNDLMTQLFVEQKPITADSVLTAAVQYGAYNADGSISKYWTGYLSKYSDIVNAQIEMEEKQKAALAQAEQEDETNRAQMQAVSDLGDGDMATAAVDVLSHAPGLDSDLEAQATAAEGSTPSAEPAAEPPKVRSFDYAGVLSQYLNEDEELNYSELQREQTYKFSDGTQITTQWAPVVERLKARIEKASGGQKMSDDALKLLIDKVDYTGENTYLFCNSAKAQEIQRLHTLMASPETTTEMKRTAVVTAIATGKLTQEEAEKEGFLKAESAYSQLPNETRKKYESKLDDALNVAIFSDKKNRKAASDDEDKYGFQAKYNTIIERAHDQLQISFNIDPENFDVDRVVQEVVANVYNATLTDSVNAAYSIVTKMYSGMSENLKLQELMDGIYNPRWVEQDNGTQAYINHTAYLNPIAEASVRDSLNLAGANTNNESLKNTDWTQLRNRASNSAFSKNYDDLPDMDKNAVDISIVKALYERDFYSTTAKRFELEEGTLYTVTMDGIGPCLVDPKTGKLYQSDGDVKTSNFYSVAKLTEDQVKEAELSYIKNRPLRGDFVNFDQWEYEGTNYKTIMKVDEKSRQTDDRYAKNAEEEARKNEAAQRWEAVTGQKLQRTKDGKITAGNTNYAFNTAFQAGEETFEQIINNRAMSEE